MVAAEKILITGVTGQVALPMAAHLARDHEVWGVARFTDPRARERVESAGVVAHAADLAGGDLAGLPDDFTYVLHLAAYQGTGLDYDHALRVNAEATGMLLAHCRSARAALVTSTSSVYARNDDRWHAFAEGDPLGDTHSPHSPTYSLSKIAQEAVARTMCRVLDLPVTIARLNASYGPNGGLPAYHLDAIRRGDPITLRSPGPTPYSPIAQDDLDDQALKLLGVASVPATVVNWAGDEVVTAEEWCAYLGELAGAEPRLVHHEFPGSFVGSVADNARRRQLIGACSVGWRDGMKAMFEARR